MGADSTENVGAEHDVLTSIFNSFWGYFRFLVALLIVRGPYLPNFVLSQTTKRSKSQQKIEI